MEMKWNPIEDGNLKGVPRDEDIIFTVLDEQTGEVYTAIGEVCDFFLDEFGQVFVGVTSYPVDTESLKAWMKLPEPYKPGGCDMCKHMKQWTDEFGYRWSKCEVLNEPGMAEDCLLIR